MTRELMSVGTTSAALTPGIRLTSADDPWTKSWERGVHSVSREALLELSRAKITRLLRLQSGWDSHRAAPPTPTAAMVLNGLLDELLFDDCATPQIAPRPDGGLDVDWLVAGNCLHIEVTPEGVVALDATLHGDEEFSGEFQYWSTDGFLLSQAVTFLGKISAEVESRLISR